MRRLRCYFCGHLYDESDGDPEGGVAPGTRFEDLPPDWVCPGCGAEQDQFRDVVG